MTRSVFNHRRRGGVYREEVLKDSPLLYWRLSELTGTTAQDETGFNRDGTYTTASGGTITLGAAGALNSEPSDPSVTLGHGTILSTTKAIVVSAASTAFDTATMTAEAWVHPTSGQTGKHGVVSCMGTNAGARWYIRLNPTTGEIEIMHDLATILTGQSVAFNAWTYLVVTFDTDSKYRVYLDGTLAMTTGPGTTSLGSPTNQPIVVGHNNGNDNGSELFTGSIDEVAVYGTALTSTRIAAHYAAAF